MEAGAQFQERGDTAVDTYGALVRHREARRQAEQRAFSSAVRAENPQAPAGFQLKRNIAQRVKGFVVNSAEPARDMGPQQLASRTVRKPLGNVLKFDQHPGLQTRIEAVFQLCEYE